MKKNKNKNRRKQINLEFKANEVKLKAKETIKQTQFHALQLKEVLGFKRRKKSRLSHADIDKTPSTTQNIGRIFLNFQNTCVTKSSTLSQYASESAQMVPEQIFRSWYFNEERCRIVQRLPPCQVQRFAIQPMCAVIVISEHLSDLLRLECKKRIKGSYINTHPRRGDGNAFISHTRM